MGQLSKASHASKTRARRTPMKIYPLLLQRTLGTCILHLGCENCESTTIGALTVRSHVRVQISSTKRPACVGKCSHIFSAKNDLIRDEILQTVFSGVVK